MIDFILNAIPWGIVGPCAGVLGLIYVGKGVVHFFGEITKL